MGKWAVLIYKVQGILRAGIIGVPWTCFSYPQTPAVSWIIPPIILLNVVWDCRGRDELLSKGILDLCKCFTFKGILTIWTWQEITKSVLKRDLNSQHSLAGALWELRITPLKVAKFETLIWSIWLPLVGIITITKGPMMLQIRRTNYIYSSIGTPNYKQ